MYRYKNIYEIKTEMYEAIMRIVLLINLKVPTTESTTAMSSLLHFTFFLVWNVTAVSAI